VEIADPLRSKQLRTGLAQLGEEGAIQVFRPVGGGMLLLGAVGNLQFDVVAHRLRHEYGCEPRLVPARYTMARWVTADDPREMKRFIDANAHRIAHDAVEAPTFLASHKAEIEVAHEHWPNIRFHALREHAGLVFHPNSVA
jgi:peptide chain release factor 3